MEDLRSRSYADGRTQIEPYGKRSYDLRSYSTSETSSYSQKEAKLNKGKSVASFKGGWMKDPELQRKKRVAGYKVYSVEGKVKGSFRKSFRWMKDPELQRKKRVAGYKVYSVEGKVKGSFRKSFRWIKDRYAHAVYGWW